MTQRDRPASAGVSERARRSPPAPPPRFGHPADGEVSPAAAWEALYQNASAAQRAEWQALAERQGVLYAHQLPAPPNGETTSGDRCRHLLGLVLGGKTDDLERPSLDTVTVSDALLDSVQRRAVVGALQTPDFFLLQGLPGTGKSRVVAEVVHLAAARGERVLLLAPSAAAIDRVIELNDGRTGICGLRCLGREERLEKLPPASRALTLAEQTRRLREEALPAAQRDVELREQSRRRIQQDEPVWEQLSQLADHAEELHGQIDVLARRRDGLAVQVEHDVADGAPGVAAIHALALTLRETEARLEASLDELRRKQNQLRHDHDFLAPEIETLRPLAEARRQGRWWTFTWWRARFRPGLCTRLGDLERRQEQAATALAEREREGQALEAERRNARATYEAERAARVDEEVRRRQAQVDAELILLRSKFESLQGEWHHRCDELAPDSPRPAEATPVAVRQAVREWQERLRHADLALTLARDSVTCLEQTAASLAERLPGYVNLVAACTTALASDPLFGDGSAHRTGFDLLVLEEADRVTESEFLALARRARRWLLVGAAPSECEVGVPGGGPSSAPRTPQLSFFRRLWQHLHTDPRRLPYAWGLEKDALYCRLWPVAAEQRGRLECERVVDFPDVELRILNPPDCPPRLAEVVFPPSMSIAQAKEYIYRELEELPVCAAGSGLSWDEHPDRIVLHLGDAPGADALPVTLEAGVREMVRPATGTANRAGWETCCIEFERGAGWQRQRAEEWARRHLGLSDLGRTASLRTPHRMAPDLAAFVAEVLAEGGYLLSSPASAAGPAVQFVAVPGSAGARPPSEPRGRPNGNHRPRTPPARAGAGLELNPNDARHRDRLPDEFRRGLTGPGLVNFLEAQAVVRTVQALHNVTMPADPKGPAIGVIALYAAQAELIRRLLAQATGGVCHGVEVGTPADFRQRDCPIVLLSLTRSHTHRAVAYGEGPRLLALALTRARRKLLVFGDPGTLLRRTQWQGPVEHLDEAAAAHERQILEGLAAYLRGQGRVPQLFQLCEGGGP